MLRMPLRAMNSVRSVVCFSEGPSTSRVNETPAEPSEYQSSEYAPSFENKSDNNYLIATKSRIQQWRQKGEIITKPTSQRLLDSNELQKLIDKEEKYYSEQVNEIVKILSDVATSLPPETTASPPKLLQIDEELKKRTGKVKFRRILYDEGELNNSDLEKPPSMENPHPFDPTTCPPPIYSRSIAPYVNKMPVLQTLVDLGVNLFEFLSVSNHQKLVNTLREIRFFFYKISTTCRYWINTDVKTIDSRLGWIQKQFYLKGNDVRTIVKKEPRIIMFGLGPLKRIFDFFHKECLFTIHEVKRILIEDPRVFMMDHRFVQKNYLFVSNVMKLSNAAISEAPFILRCSFSSLKNRHDFLRKLGRAYYAGQLYEKQQHDEEIVDPISMVDFLHPSDSHFASRAGKSYLVVYDKFLRNH